MDAEREVARSQPLETQGQGAWAESGVRPRRGLCVPRPWGLGASPWVC